MRPFRDDDGLTYSESLKRLEQMEEYAKNCATCGKRDCTINHAGLCEWCYEDGYEERAKYIIDRQVSLCQPCADYWLEQAIAIAKDSVRPMEE